MTPALLFRFFNLARLRSPSGTPGRRSVEIAQGGAYLLAVVLGVSLLVPSLVACSPLPTPQQLGGGSSASLSNPTQVNGAGSDGRPLVSALHLDDADMIVPFAAVGEQEFMNSRSPWLTFNAVEKADFYEAIRCPEDAVINGGQSLQQIVSVVLGSVSTNDRVAAMQRNDYWTNLANSPRCVVVTTGFSQTSFLDSWAPSGSWYWFVHACVASERLTDTRGGSTRNCSRQLSVTNLLRDFVNERTADANAALQDAQKYQDLTDAAGREIFFDTQAYGKAITTCASVEAQREARLQREGAIATLTGVGLSIGLSMIGAAQSVVNGTGKTVRPVNGTAQVNPAALQAGRNSIQTQGLSFSQAIQMAWNPSAGVIMAGYEGQILGQAILGLFEHPDDIINRSCTGATEAQTKGQNAAQKMKYYTQLYAAAMDRGFKINTANNQAQR